MTSSLSPDDVARLLAEPSVAVRSELAAKVALEIDSAQLTPDELAIAQDIARLMAQDVAQVVRQALAESLRNAAHLPRDVALRLANDVEGVALPILSASPALSDDDLIAILRRATAPQQQAIASRPEVSEPVSDAVVATAEEAAVATLMRNKGARIAEPSLHRAVDRFPASDAVKTSMVHRASLPMEVAERLVVMVSEDLRRYLLAHHALSASIAADLVLQSRERAVVGLSLRASREELTTLIRQMHRHQRLTPSLILRALCMGDLAFFEIALAVRARVPVENAQILVHDAGGKGLASLYRKAGLPETLLPVFQVAVEAANSTGLDGGERDFERYRSRVITRVLSQCEDFGPDDLDYLVGKLGDLLSLPSAASAQAS
ncbi:MAG TPA: DUF2336 domain-containing protein [Acetobacteraceae bacterium]|jgi:uncharacterized protein (DUF2336 family)|nr:DUF2336 domain-containing protein [Acetobacteraceae bacterium]